MEIKVTIIVPVRDRLRMLSDLLNSLLLQDFPADHMEVIVVDGDSTAPLQELVVEYDSKAPFSIRYLKVDVDRGPVSKRNLAANEAKGALLAFTDSDCRATPGWLSAITKPMADPKVGFVSGPVTYKPEQTKTFFSKLTAETLVEHPTYPTANVCYRRDLFLEMGGFDDSLGVRDFLGRATECGDTDLAWRIRKAGWQNVFAPDALILHEVEGLPPTLWLLEPTRLILLPKLLRLHPEIGPLLLSWNVIFYKGTLVVYAALLFFVVALIVEPWFLPLGVLGAAVGIVLLKAKSWRPTEILGLLRKACLHFCRMAVLAATLIAGSLRYGRLVL